MHSEKGTVLAVDRSITKDKVTEPDCEISSGFQFDLAVACSVDRLSEKRAPYLMQGEKEIEKGLLE